MKKLLFILLSIFIQIICFSQDYNALNSKYWYYRSRLRNDFMLVGSGPGCSIPMEERGLYYRPSESSSGPFTFPDPWNGESAQWGDAMGELGYYIGVLATEYKLLELNGQETDSVRLELFYAMDALNRMDYWAETAFSQATSTVHAPTINGFMVRDDVPSNFIDNNFKHFNYFGNKGFCSKIKINNLAGSSGTHAIKTGGHWDGIVYRENYGGAYISQDNWYNCLVGLALVRKLLPNPSTYNTMNFKDGTSNINQEAFAIALRVQDYFKRYAFWELTYPAGNLIGSNDGGIAYGYSFPHSEALNKMDKNKWGYFSFQPSLSFDNWCEFDNWRKDGNAFVVAWKNVFVIPLQSLIWFITPHTSGNLGGLLPAVPLATTFFSPVLGTLGSPEFVYKAAMSFATNKQDVETMTLNLSAVCNCDYNYRGNTTKQHMQVHVNKFNQFAPALLRMVLHGYENCDPYTTFDQGYFDGAVSLCNSAPCEGPFRFNDVYGVSQASVNPEWSSTSRLDHPKRLYPEANDFPGEYNGLDYMLYHNLVSLLAIEKDGVNPYDSKRMVDFGRRHITTNYPLTIGTIAWGSNTNPAIIKSFEFITLDNTINTNAVVTALAGKEIVFGPGFSSVLPNMFTAAIQQFTCSEIMGNPLFNGLNAREGGKPNNSNGVIYPDLGATSYEQKQTTALDEDVNTSSNTNTGLVYVDNFLKTQNSLGSNINASIAPNPNNGVSKLFITQPNLVKQIEVIDQLGKTLLTIETTSFTNDINLSNYGKGVYSVILKGADGDVMVKKIIVQ